MPEKWVIDQSTGGGYLAFVDETTGEMIDPRPQKIVVDGIEGLSYPLFRAGWSLTQRRMEPMLCQGKIPEFGFSGTFNDVRWRCQSWNEHKPVEFPGFAFVAGA